METSIPRQAPVAPNGLLSSPPLRSRWLAVALYGSLALTGCPAGPAADHLAEEAAKRTVTVDDSIDPVREAFNAHRGEPRLVAVLSSSCPRCREGAVAVAGPLLAARPDLKVTLIWTRVLPYDRSAQRRIESFYDPDRITHLADPKQVAARAVADQLGWPRNELAYDVFLLFDPDAEWGSTMPTPSAWFHQRRDLEPERYRTEESLERALIEAARAL